MTKKTEVLKVLLKNYTKIGYKEGIAKVIFDDEFEGIAEDIVKLFSIPVVSNQRELLIAFLESISTSKKDTNLVVIDAFLKERESNL